MIMSKALLFWCDKSDQYVYFLELLNYSSFLNLSHQKYIAYLNVLSSIVGIPKILNIIIREF